MRGLLVAIACCLPLAAQAGVVAARNLAPGTIIAPEDVVLDPDSPAGLPDPDMAVGQQARIAIYQGRPVMAGALRAPVLVSRNQIVTLHYNAGPLRIATEGRALSEGAAGDTVRAMNLSSRKTLSAVVAEDGSLIVGQGAALR